MAESAAYAISLFLRPEDFRGAIFTDWMSSHTEMPVFAVCLYSVFVYYGQEVMKYRKPYSLALILKFWNFLLAAFSIYGAYCTVPFLLKTIFEKGVIYSFCEDKSYFYDGQVGLWLAVFVLSKTPELMDTVWLILQKKPIRFLHWYHHCTVLLYCWHGYQVNASAGFIYTAMNYFVHAVMYSYYFFMCFKTTRGLVKPFAPLVTVLQILQMVFGTAVAITIVVVQSGGGECSNQPGNVKLGLAMYCSYFVLFAQLFYQSYIKGDPKAKAE